VKTQMTKLATTPLLRSRVRIGPVFIDPLTMEEAVGRILQLPAQGLDRACIVATVNAQFVHIASKQPRFAKVLANAELVVADGMSVVLASRILGRAVPERITGVDLIVNLCAQAAQQDISVYFLGGKPGAAEETALRLLRSYPRLAIAGIDCPEFGFEKSAAESAAVLRRIKEASPSIIFVGLGAPKQEFWMEQHAALFPGAVMMGVGGSFDMLAGDKQRAPLWIQQAGLEWLFRLWLEPRRLWKRYLLGNTKFLQILFEEWMRGRQLF